MTLKLYKVNRTYNYYCSSYVKEKVSYINPSSQSFLFITLMGYTNITCYTNIISDTK